MTTDTEDIVSERIGATLKHIREDRQLSQEELGNIVDMSGQEVDEYERGTIRILSDDFLKFVRGLDVPVSTFFVAILDDEIKIMRSVSKHLRLAHLLEKIDNPELENMVMETLDAMIKEQEQETAKADLQDMASSKERFWET